MSILNDDRRYGTDEERAEWKADLITEYEEHYPDYPYERERYCAECEFCKLAQRFVDEIVIREADGKQVYKKTNRYCFIDICVRDIEHIKEIHDYDEVCEDHGELFEIED